MVKDKNIPNVILSQSIIELPLTQDKFTIIDMVDEDLTRFLWFAHKDRRTYYAQRQIDAKTISIHRVILERILNRSLSEKECVDHIDMDGLNNCRSNLRLATFSENSCNRGLQINNTTGFKGVKRHGNKYQAKIEIGNKSIHLGTFDTPEKAYQAYLSAIKMYHGDFARDGRK